jgi:hypothetical protein
MAPYLVNLHSHGLASGNGALVGDGPGAGIAADVGAGDTADGVVAQGETSAGATVIWVSARRFMQAETRYENHGVGRLI